MYTGLTDTQLSGMGTALSQGGTGLLHIAIQIMPYVIAFTIIFLIFRLIKNWSKLRFTGENQKKVKTYVRDYDYYRGLYEDNFLSISDSDWNKRYKKARRLGRKYNTESWKDWVSMDPDF